MSLKTLSYKPSKCMALSALKKDSDYSLGVSTCIIMKEALPK